jgi:hypothetical protein
VRSCAFWSDAVEAMSTFGKPASKSFAVIARRHQNQEPGT